MKKKRPPLGFKVNVNIKETTWKRIADILNIDQYFTHAFTCLYRLFSHKKFSPSSPHLPNATIFPIFLNPSPYFYIVLYRFVSFFHRKNASLKKNTIVLYKHQSNRPFVMSIGYQRLNKYKIK